MVNNKMKPIYMSLMAATLALSSCGDFLDVMPDNRTTLDTAEKIEDLLVTAYPTASYAIVNELMSDNTDYYGTINPYGDRFGDQVYFWQDVTENSNESSSNLWTNFYGAIANTNQALAAIEEMGGATTDQLRACKAEALLCRAYCHFFLVNEFCLNYNKQTSQTDLGIPYSDKIEELEGHSERGTVASVYERIEQDILEALPLVGNTYEVPKYHFNQRAAYAFACRFFLYYEKWDEARKYADLCLGSSPATMMRDWEGLSNMVSDYTALSQEYVNENSACNLLLMTSLTNAGLYFAPNFYYKRYAHGRYVAQTETVVATNLWGSDSYFMRPSVYSGTNFDFVIWYKVPYLREYLDPVSQVGYPHTVTPIFTADETLLNRAEALIMMKRYDEAAADLNTWIHAIADVDGTVTPTMVQRFYNTRSYAYSDANGMLSALKKHLHPAFEIDEEGSVQETMLQCVLGCRRIETLQEGLRWFDIKRYGIEIVRRTMGSDGTPAELNDVLKVDDPRRAVQIPYDVRQAGIEANPR